MTALSLTPTVVLFVAIGGSLGAVARLIITQWATHFSSDFPPGVFLANAIGTFLAGFTYSLIQQKILFGDYWTPLLLVGFFGALTTFSAFSLEALIMLQQAAYVNAMIYVLSSVLVCLVFTWLGMQLGSLYQ